MNHFVAKLTKYLTFSVLVFVALVGLVKNPSLVLADNESTPSAQIVANQTDNQTIQPSNTTPNNKVVLNQVYTSPFNNQLSIKFTSLPTNPGTLTFNQVNLSNEQKNSSGAISSTAFDISSSMANGTFSYDLTLPLPAGADSSHLAVKYGETADNLTGVIKDVTVNSDNTITIHNINHFTVFVVTTDQTSDCTGGVYNGTCYSTVQAAVNASSANDTINISSGTYNESVTVNHSLTFNGVDTGTGYPTITTVTVNASPVNFNHVTVTNLNYPDTQAPVISGVSITNATVIKNGSSVTVTATVTDNNQSSITASMITANLSSLGGGSAVNPVSYNTSTGLATWAALTVSGTTNGLSTVTINAHDSAGNNATAQSASVLTDNISPAQATGVALTSQISQVNQTNVAVTGNGEVGATVNYTISNGASSISGIGTVSNSGAINITGVNVSTLPEGTLTLSLTLTDTAGNTSTATTAAATKDTIAPTTSDNANNSWFNHSVTVTLSCSDATSGCAHTYYTVDGSTPTTTSSQGTSVVFSLEGVYTIKYFSVDNYGNTEGVKTATNQVRIDLTNPTTSSNNVIAGWYTVNPTITLSASDALSGLNNVRYNWDSSASASVGTVFTNGTTINIPSDGSHVLYLFANDQAGNPVTSSATYRLDTVNPVTSATGSSAAWQTTLPTITISATDTLPGSNVSTVTYQWDTGAVVSTSNGADITTSFPGDGTHTLNLVVTDVSGRTGTFTGTYKIDRVKPTTTDNTDNLWHTSPVTITLSCSDVTSGCATTYYTTNGSTPTTSSASGTSIVLNIDGVYTIKYFSVDVAGNAETVVTALNQVKLDQTKPVTTDTGTDNLWHKNPVTVTLNCTDNLSGCSQIVYTTDGSDPVTSGTRTVISGSSTVITLSTQGVYTINYYSIDQAGNTEVTKTAANTVKIDTTLPTISSNNVIAGWYTSNPTITLSVGDLGGSLLNNVRYSWDTPATATVGTVFVNGDTINIPSDGSRTLYLYADDNATNSQTFSATYRLDRSNPSVTASGSSALWQTTLPTITVTATDTLPGSGVATVTYQWDSGAVVSTSNGTNITASFPGDGTHILTLVVTDHAGLTSTTTLTYRIDRVKPVTTDNADGLWHNIGVTITLNCSDVTSGCATTYYTTDGSIPTTSSASGTSITLSANGVYTIKYFSIDVAGNAESVVVAANQVKIDTTSPIVSGLALTNNTTGNNSYVKNGDTITLTVSITDNNQSLITTSMIAADLSVFGLGSAVNPTSYNTTTGVATWSNLLVSASINGFASVTVSMHDIASNPGSQTAIVTLVDDNAPSTIDNTDNLWHTSPVTITLTCSDSPVTNPSGCTRTYYTTDGSTPTTSSTSGTTIVLNVDGIYTIKYFSVDMAGNIGTVLTALNQVKLDQTSPVATWVNPIANSTISGLLNLNTSNTDNLSGVASVQILYKRNDGVDTFHLLATLNSVPYNTSWNTTGIPLDIYTLRIITTDVAGNSITVDEVVTVVTVITPVSSNAGSQTSANIDWNTANLTTSQIVYDTVSHGTLGAVTNYGYAFATSVLDPQMVLNHSVSIYGLSVGTTYYYRIISAAATTAISSELKFQTLSNPGPGASGGQSSSSQPSSTGVSQSPGSASTITQARVLGQGQVELSWTKAAGPLTGYMLVFGRKPGSSEYGAPYIGDANTTSYIVNFLQPGVKYYFRIIPLNGGVLGTASVEFVVTASGAGLSVPQIAKSVAKEIITAPATPVNAEGFSAVSSAPTPSSSINPFQQAKTTVQNKVSGSLLDSILKVIKYVFGR